MMRAVLIAAFAVAALAGWSFVIGYAWRTRGNRHPTLWWHLTLFTGVIAVVFTLAIVVRVIDIPGIEYIARVLYWAIALLLVQRTVLMFRATRKRRR